MKTAIKSLSWALVSLVIIFVPAYWETGSLRVATVTAVAAVLLKTPFFSVHEWLFEKLYPKPGVKTAKGIRSNERIVPERLGSAGTNG